MTLASKGQNLILGVHPFSRGFGWALLKAPLAPHDWGIVEIKKNSHDRCLTRIDEILERYEPAVLILEQFERRPARRGQRVQLFCNAILSLAATRGVEQAIYTRAAIRTCFADFGAHTRYEVAKVIALHVAEFRKHLPPKRRPWQSEDCRQSLFDAAALAITHFAVRGDHGFPP